jgi:hypothetical protein
MLAERESMFRLIFVIILSKRIQTTYTGILLEEAM